MADYTITLTDAQRDAFIVMLNSSVENIESDLETYLVSIADSHVESALDSEFKAKTKSEKETLLS